MRIIDRGRDRHEIGDRVFVVTAWFQQVLEEHLVADPGQGIEPGEPLLDISLEDWVGDIFQLLAQRQKVVKLALQRRFLFGRVVLAEHAIGKSAEPEWHVFGVDEREPEDFAELAEIGHGRGAVDA